MRNTFSILILLFSTFQIKAQVLSLDTLKINEIGVLKISSITQDSFRDISSKILENTNFNTVDEALSLIPGITQAQIGNRNEGVFFLRGFDVRQVSVFQDGIPIYVPFDGYLDLARFTVFDLGLIEINMGGGAVLNGPNALGGSINLVSKRPQKKLEIKGERAFISGGSRWVSSFGTKQKKFFAQAIISSIERTSYPLSKSFAGNRLENGGNRDNSFNQDNKINFAIGFTPNKRVEHSLNFIYQNGEKGNPVYAGTDTLNPLFKNSRFWYWPYWNKQSAYYLGSIKLRNNNALKARVFYDQFDNKLQSFDDGNLNSQLKRYAFNSIYKDQTYGGNLDFQYNQFKKHQLTVSVQYKNDVHQEQDNDDPFRKMSDNNFSVGVHDKYLWSEKLTILFGLSAHQRNSLVAQNQLINNEFTLFPANNSQAINGYLKSIIQLGKHQQLSINAAKTSRFATLKDRYSFRLGRAIPNPDLLAEQAFNFSLDLEGNKNKLGYLVSLYNSEIFDIIQEVQRVRQDTNGAWLNQQQNLGKARFFGADFQINYQFNQQWKVILNYGFIERELLDNRSNVFLTNVPQHQLMCWLQYLLNNKFMGNLMARYSAERVSTSYGTVVQGFMVIDTKLAYNLSTKFNLNFGLNNLLDLNYALVEGFPAMGRNFSVGLNWDL